MKKTEIFIIDEKTLKTTIFRYDDPTMFDLMLARFQNWQAQGRLSIIEVR